MRVDLVTEDENLTIECGRHHRHHKGELVRRAVARQRPPGENGIPPVIADRQKRALLSLAQDWRGWAFPPAAAWFPCMCRRCIKQNFPQGSEASVPFCFRQASSRGSVPLFDPHFGVVFISSFAVCLQFPGLGVGRPDDGLSPLLGRGGRDAREPGFHPRLGQLRRSSSQRKVGTYGLLRRVWRPDVVYHLLLFRSPSIPLPPSLSIHAFHSRCLDSTGSSLPREIRPSSPQAGAAWC